MMVAADQKCKWDGMFLQGRRTYCPQRGEVLHMFFMQHLNVQKQIAQNKSEHMHIIYHSTPLNERNLTYIILTSQLLILKFLFFWVTATTAAAAAGGGGGKGCCGRQNGSPPNNHQL